MTSHQPPKGYTLIELLVSLSIFAIVMLSATAAYLSFISYNRQAQTTATVVDSLSFSVDSMARDIRTGTGYTGLSTGNCSTGGVSSLRFTDANGCTVTYARSGTGITRSVDTSPSGCSVDTSETNAAITDPSIAVSSLCFYLRGTAGSSDPSDQPMANIVIRGQGTVPNSTTVVPFNIETGATMRVPDL